MTFELNQQAKKREELVTLLRDALLQQDTSLAQDETAERILEIFAHITPPVRGEYLEMVRVTTHSGRGGGSSSKAGNVRLNMRKLIEAIASGVFTVLSVKEAPWAVPFAAIMLWNSLLTATQVELTEKEVAILLTMWRIKDSEKYVKESLLFSTLSEHMNKNDLPQITTSDVKFGLDRLVRIRAIERSKRANGEWFLIESIQCSYY